jgi:integrase
MANKHAKTLTKGQFEKLVTLVRQSEHALRDEAALRLSFYGGLRACEVANLRWKDNLLDPTGKMLNVIHITSNVAKRSRERSIPMEPELKRILKELRRRRPDDEFVFYSLHNNVIPMVTKVDPRTGVRVRVPDPNYRPGRVTPSAVVQFFKRLYAEIGYDGCTSHSGRRTFITARARLANLKKCSIKDVQELAGHARLDTTATYIDPSEFQRDLVAAW